MCACVCLVHCVHALMPSQLAGILWPSPPFAGVRSRDLPLIALTPSSMSASAKSDGKSAGAASRIGDAISKSGGKSTVATTTAAQQKRDASKRYMLANADTPQHVKDKWEAICKLGKGMNKAKEDFSEVLAKDAGSWTDGYWQANFGEKHSHKNMNTAEWMLRSKAVHDHGGGQAGEAAIDDAVAAGIYEERCVFSGKDKFGKPISIKQIRVTGERSDRAHTAELLEKVRVGTAADADTFKKALTNMAGGVSIKDQPKKQKQPALAAIEDNKPPSVASRKKPAAATPKAGNVIRTMMKGVSAKRPAAIILPIYDFSMFVSSKKHKWRLMS